MCVSAVQTITKPGFLFVHEKTMEKIEVEKPTAPCNKHQSAMYFSSTKNSVKNCGV